MMTGTGRIAIGESAASTKYRMTLASDKRLVSPAPERRASEPFVVDVPEPPAPPRPAMARPTPPRKPRGWDDHGWLWRLQHHVHLYNHSRASRKQERAEQEARDYARNVERWREDSARFEREEREYKLHKKTNAKLLVTPPAPPKPPLEELDEYEQATAVLRTQIKQLARQSDQQFNYVMELQASCVNSLNKTKELLATSGTEALAALKAKDYLNAKRELERAKNKYVALSDEQQCLVDLIERAADVAQKRLIGENVDKLSEKIAEDLEEIRSQQMEIRERKVPEAIMPESELANNELNELLAKIQTEMKNKTRQDLGIDTKTAFDVPQHTEAPMLG